AGGRCERRRLAVRRAVGRAARASAVAAEQEVLRKLTSTVFGEIVTAIEAHEGTIEAVAGDSVTGVFGLPRIHDDDAVRAHRSAEEIRSRVASSASETDGDPGFDVRVGVATGVVMTGPGLGPLARVTGEPMIAASRLAQHALPGEVALDEASRRGVLAAERDPSRFTSPMVGRERERRRLLDAYEQAVNDRSCQLFTVLGSA